MSDSVAEPWTSDPFTLPRISTGSREIDDILAGGLPAGSINILMGTPGTGKTVLAEQVIFTNAEPERPAVYLTTLSEPMAKVLTYLQEFSFYAPEKLSGAVVYEEVGHGLLEHGVEYLQQRVGELIRELSPRLLVIDSFKALHDLTAGEEPMRRLSSGLAGLLSAYELTTLLVGEYTFDDLARLPEFAAADGVVELARTTTDRRDQRFLRVLKLRGSSYREGRHAFRITADGLQVFPRLVTPEVPRDYRPSRERTSSGVEGLDELLDGGLYRGSTTLVAGPSGSGKTTFGLGFALDGAREGEPALYLHFQENPAQLARSLASLGMDPAGLEARGFHRMYCSPVELQIDSILVELFDLVEEHGIRRLVIDAVGDLAEAAAERERFRDYLYALVQRLTAKQVTALFTLETDWQPRDRATDGVGGFSAMTDGIIELGIDLAAAKPRFLRVRKARGIAHDIDSHDLEIFQGGLRVLPGARA